jgi:glycosyltransferase involved in cell wall biosynthesis
VKVLVAGTGGELVGSGITTMADQLSSSLRSMGHEVMRLHLGNKRRARPNRLNLSNVRALLSEMFELSAAVRHERPDVVWIHTFGVPTLPAIRALLIVAAARLGGSGTVLHFHAFELAKHVDEGRRMLRITLRAVGRVAAVLVALHESDAAALRRASRANVQMLPNWVEVPPAPSALPSGPPYTAVFVGSLTSRKGIVELLDAMRALDDVPLVLRVVGGAGDEGAGAARRYEISADDLVSAGAVTFVGELPQVGVREELRRAHVLVLPSEAEGMPRAVLEGFAEGRGAVVAGPSHVADLVERSGAGDVVRTRASTDLAGVLRCIVSQEGWFETASRRTRVALEQHSEEAAVDRITGVLRAAASSSSP